MDLSEAKKVAKRLVAPGKGILAADESTGTIRKRFDSISVESTEENRRSYRELLFRAPEVESFLGGVILFDETARQAAKDGTPLPQVLAGRGIVPGIKVDSGAKDLAAFPGEKITEGLDGLRERFAEYARMGLGFSKWRAVIEIDDARPTDACVRANAHALARYAALSLEAGIVPIVEPEVLMDGGHTLERCAKVTEFTLKATFQELEQHRVDLAATLLKPNMVLPGKKCERQASDEDIAQATVRCLKAAVPSSVPGIVFLSGGQSSEEATRRLNAMNQLGEHPWQLSFSYGRALQEATLKAWAGKKENVERAQKVFLHRARCNGAARTGDYSREMELATA